MQKVVVSRYNPNVFRVNQDVNLKIQRNVDKCLVDTHFRHLSSNKKVGKVRDMYETMDQSKVVIVTTDRLSAFDRVVSQIPFKGQVLNQTAAHWFNETEHIVENALLSVPHPRVCVMEKLDPVPIEFVVRGFMTGSTETSLWTHYKKGGRTFCGHELEDGLHKNQQLRRNIVTPTTKGIDKDTPTSRDEIVNVLGILTADEYDHLEKIALNLFAHGQKEAAKQGLILVDTKYEFGKSLQQNNKFLLMDEIHTPDSSRYWFKASYEQNLEHGLEPDYVDKEFIRLWLIRNNGELVPSNMVCELSRRYVFLYETITGKAFVPCENDENIEELVINELY